MTAQISDTIIYQGRNFTLAGINGEGLFDPDQIGLEVFMISTGCYAGFYCTYTIRDDRLLLTKLTVGFNGEDRAIAERGEGPIHFGVHPQRDPRPDSHYYPWSNWYYGELAHPVEFTGTLSIGTDFIQEMYEHMGYHPDYKYREVYELVFQSGRLESVQDCSEKMAKFRDVVGANHPLAPPNRTDKEGIREWIRRTFDRSSHG